jgi:enediyne biosynthesis protein E4
MACCWALPVLGGLAWEEGTGFRSAAVSPSGNARAGFELMSPERTVLQFTNRLALERYMTNQIYLNGSGVALGDVDGDGWCDVYLSGLDTPNALFRNLGDWRFQDITERSGVACPGLASSGAAFADLDGDGDLDLVVNSVGQGTHLFLNDGSGRFQPAPGGPLNRSKAGTSLAFADIDGDGDLDLYVVNYRTDTIRDYPRARLQGQTIGGQPVIRSFEGRPMTDPDLVGRFTITATGRIVEHGEVDALFRNEGQGRFVPVAFTGGAFRDEDGRPLADPPYDWGLSAMFRDIDGDGAPDLYVANDFESPDRFWLNDGTGHFRAVPRLALRHTSIFSMGVDFGDLNRDGHDDIVVSDMLMQTHASRHLRIGDVPPVHLEIGAIEDRPQYSANTVFINRGDGTYAEIAHYARAEASGWTWCPVLLDIDLDGYEDLIFPTGHERDMMNADVIEAAEVIKAQQRMSRLQTLYLRTMFQRFDTPNVAFRNRGDLTFEDVSDEWGFTDREVSQGIALGDLDNDGDLDVVVNNLNSTASLYRNVTTAPRVAVRLNGLPPNPHGIGARIHLHGGPVPNLNQEMIAGGRYLSGDDPIRVFAAGADPEADLWLEVRWRSGLRSVVRNVQPNRLYVIDESSARRDPIPPASSPTPWFEEVGSFSHSHTETPFEDFHRQPLLPHRLSQLGPGVAWTDLDRDGWEDLIVGSGMGGNLAAFKNHNGTNLTPMDLPFLSRPLARDSAGLTASEGVVLAGSANYEDGLTDGGSLRIYDFNRQTAGESVMGQASSVGPLALGDVDGDGQLDLFVGGRVVPGRYPEPADSLLLLNRGGRLTIGQRFEKLGLVSGAVFTDIDNDGDLDLIVALDWGPIKLFRNENGEFRDDTEAAGLGAFTGCWNGVTTGDLDNDGRPDIIAGNWGLNSRYRASPQHPRRLYYTDLDGNGTLDIVEAYVDPVSGAELPDRGFKPVGMALPWLKDQIRTYEAYGEATLRDLYQDRLDNAGKVQVNTLASMVFMNRGDRFEARLLPPKAQVTTAMGVSVADFDGDGNDDVFLSQNFFAVAQDAWRQDAGRGLWLKGDGQGNLEPVPGHLSGVMVYGEQRGCAVADYDQDGRVDLVVTQNGAATKLFRNVRAKPGLRVRLIGPPGNPTAIGAAVRLQYADHYGPRREIRAGSGYWSQDSPVPVLGLAGEPTHLEIRWPGGQIMSVPVRPGTREIRVDMAGRVQTNP